MRKFFALALSAAMIMCPFTSYAAQTEEGIAVYREITEKANTLNDMHAYYDMNLVMSGNAFDSLESTPNSSDLNMRLEMDMRVVNAKDMSQMRYSAYSRMTFLGEQMDFNMYYENGWMFMELAGQKQRMEMPLNTMQSSLESTQGLSMFSSESIMTDLSVRQDGENRILSYRMDDAMLNQLMQAALAQGGTDQLLEGMTFTIRNIYGEYVVRPDGFYNDATMHMEMELTYQNENMIFTIDGKIHMPDPGGVVEIPRPDLNSYAPENQM